MQKDKTYIVFIISIAISLAVGGLSAFLTRNSMDIYQSINQPLLSPPAILFPVVWTILYILMGISSAIVYIHGKETDVSGALKIYAFQLVVNFFWSIIFFNMRAYLFAFVWLIILWLLIISMIVSFRKISSIEAYLQIPYFSWVTFAGYLNFMIYFLNK